MKQKALVPTLAALACGLGVTISVVSYLTPDVCIYPTTMVVVAAVPLKIGDPIIDVETQLTLKPFPNPLVLVSFLTNPQDLKGKTVLRQIQVGEPITLEDVNFLPDRGFPDFEPQPPDI